MDAKAAAWRHEHNGRAWMAWHIAMMTRAKKMPDLKRLLAKEPQRRQSWQEQQDIMAAWAVKQRSRELLKKR